MINTKVSNYWRNPGDNNIAQNYIDPEKHAKRTEMMFQTISKYADKNDSILELGCNVGRNLNRLMEGGYTKVSGLEISEIAVKLGEKTYPNLVGKIKIGAFEDEIKNIKPADVVFTRAVLEHVPRESDWILPEIEKLVGKYLITIEDEKSDGWKHFNRNYKQVFSNLEQVEEKRMDIETYGLNPDFIMRVFKKK